MDLLKKKKKIFNKFLKKMDLLKKKKKKNLFY